MKASGFFYSHARWARILPLVALLITGCSTATMTNPSHSVTEQLLLSTAADRAIESVSFVDFAGKRVFLDGTNYFESYDSKYVIGAIRDALSQAGARLMNAPSNSEIIIEARSGGLSIDSSSSLFGVPQIGLPIPLEHFRFR